MIAHRGASRERPENTLSAFLRALDRGADAVELDVHATRDAVVVVHHDPVPRASPPSPALAGRRISRLSLHELSDFRVDGERIPTLAEVLDAIGDKVTVYVEVKGHGIEAAVVECIRRSRARCAVHSFDHRVAVRVRELEPALPTGILVASYLLDPVAAMRQARARDYWCAWDLIDGVLVSQVHAAGGRVIAWTVNGTEDWAALAALGVDGICSDDVALVRRPPATGRA